MYEAAVSFGTREPTKLKHFASARAATSRERDWEYGVRPHRPCPNVSTIPLPTSDAPDPDDPLAAAVSLAQYLLR